ncbi:MAG: hypothetical protein AAGF32_00770 [Pseudomonadota bacterium]
MQDETKAMFLATLLVIGALFSANPQATSPSQPSVTLALLAD